MSLTFLQSSRYSQQEIVPPTFAAIDRASSCKKVATSSMLLTTLSPELWSKDTQLLLCCTAILTRTKILDKIQEKRLLLRHKQTTSTNCDTNKTGINPHVWTEFLSRLVKPNSPWIPRCSEVTKSNSLEVGSHWPCGTSAEPAGFESVNNEWVREVYECSRARPLTDLSHIRFARRFERKLVC